LVVVYALGPDIGAGIDRSRLRWVLIKVLDWWSCWGWWSYRHWVLIDVLELVVVSALGSDIGDTGVGIGGHICIGF